MNQRHTRTMPQAVRFWMMGLAASFFVAWGIAAVFGGSLRSVAWDEQLQQYVALPGSTVRQRREGWADMLVGRHGLSMDNAALLESGQPVFLFWGDSLVEALQVPAQRKTMAVYNEQPGVSTKGVAIGGSGKGIADYCFEAPKFEAAYPQVKGHVFAIVKMKDVLPGKHNPGLARFLSDPWRLEPSRQTVSKLSLTCAPILQRVRLDMLWGLYSGIKDYSFRFSPGQVVGGADVSKPVMKQWKGIEEGWEFLMDELGRRTEKPWVFLYIPMYPRVADGAVDITDNELALKRRFQAVCRAKGVTFLDASETFLELYEEQGKLPFGFFNMPPGPTHLNRTGHAALAGYLQSVLEF